MSETVLLWWRIVLNGEQLVSVEPVEVSAQSDGLTIFYVEASTRDAALRSARRIAGKRRRIIYREQGRCACGRQMSSKATFSPITKLPHLRCEVCRVRQAEAHERRKAPEYTRKQGSENYIKRHQSIKSTHRLEVLLEVRQAWADAENNNAFSQWLRNQIEAVVRETRELPPDAGITEDDIAPDKAGENNGRAVLSDIQVQQLRQRAVDGESYNDISRRFGISKSQVARLVKGQQRTSSPSTNGASARTVFTCSTVASPPPLNTNPTH